MTNYFDEPCDVRPEIPGMDNLTPEEQNEAHLKAALYGCITSIMIAVIGLVVMVFLLASCKTKYIPVVELRDSIRTEVVTNTVIIPDTQYVELPAQVVERTTPDTVSTLRTSFAESTATIKGGMLHHILRNLENPIPVPVQHKETTRDSIVYREKEVPVPVPVVKEVERQLTKWQKLRLWLGNAVIVAIAAAAGVWLVRRRAWWIRLLRIFTK